MLGFPLYYILIPFGVLFSITALFFFFNIFHLKRYAIKSQASTMVITAYVVSFGIIVVLILLYLTTVSWSQTVTPADLMPSFTGSTRI